MPQRSMPPSAMEGPYHVYEVTDIPLPGGWRIEMPEMAPWFGQPGGGGIQYRVVPPEVHRGPVVGELVKIGYSIERPWTK